MFCSLFNFPTIILVVHTEVGAVRTAPETTNDTTISCFSPAIILNKKERYVYKEECVSVCLFCIYFHTVAPISTKFGMAAENLVEEFQTLENVPKSEPTNFHITSSLRGSSKQWDRPSVPS
jgi:hypothetical protein